ncbi:MAG: hypothetical protein V6Z81_02905 [Parvularculales bacterium]
MTIHQLFLDLPHHSAVGRDDFFMNEANAHALSMIDCWPSWPDRVLVLCGPEGSGKSHLACVWQQISGAQMVDLGGLNQALAEGIGQCAVIVEDIHQCPKDGERKLLHLVNMVRQEKGWLLLTSRLTPTKWPICLPDLASRLRAAPHVFLESPDDTLLAAVLDKLLRDRQLRVSEDLVHYMVSRMERSLAAAGRLVEALDAVSLGEGKSITKGLVLLVLAKIMKEGRIRQEVTGFVSGGGATYSDRGSLL